MSESRVEDILTATINDTEVTDPSIPQSRVEALLMDLKDSGDKFAVSNQGPQNAGKIWAVGNNGDLTLVPAGTAGVTTAGDVSYINGTGYTSGSVGAAMETAEGDITQLKSDIVKLKFFVTPEMFGATGDGVADDTEYVQAAIDYAITNKITVKILGIYGISQPLSIAGNTCIVGVGKSSGFKCIDNTLEAFIKFDNKSHGYDSTGLFDLQFDANGSSAYGIEFTNSFIMYNQMYRIEFNGFANPCIHLTNSAGVVSGYGVYAHDIQWSNILAMNCSTLIGQTGTNAYIYGGVLEHVSMEGTHAGDDYAHYMDLTGFRSVKLSNIIIEGSPTAQKSSAIKMNHGMDIDTLYFEFPSQYSSYYPENLIRVDNAGFSTQMNVRNLYGKYYAPIYLTGIDMLVHYAGLSSLNEIVGVGNQLDSRSTGSRLTFENAYFGGTFAPNSGNRIVQGDCYYKQIKLLAQQFLMLNNDTPLIDYDLSQITTNGSGLYGTTGYLMAPSGYAGSFETSVVEDKVWGHTLTITTTSEDNYLHCAFSIVQSGLPIKLGKSCTLVITLKANAEAPTDANKYYLNNAGTSSRDIIFGTNVKDKDVITTLVIPLQTYNGGVSNVYIDSPSSGDTAATPRSYTIFNISLFKDLVFGACKSKTYIEMPSVNK